MRAGPVAQQRHPHLHGAASRLHAADTGAEATTHDRRDVCALAREQNGAEREVRVQRLRDALGDAHGGCDHEDRPSRVAGLDELGCADGELAVVVLDDQALCALLDREPQRVADRGVEPAVHDAEAIRRAYHRTSRSCEVVALDHLDVVAICECGLPRTHHHRRPIDEQDLHRRILAKLKRIMELSGRV
jgi:hypothetical protein